VSDADRPAVRVDDRRVDIGPLGQAGQSLGGEGLVQLDNDEVAPADARPLECLLGGADRGDAVQRRLHRGDRIRRDAGEGRAPQRVACRLGRQQESGGAVVER